MTIASLKPFLYSFLLSSSLRSFDLLIIYDNVPANILIAIDRSEISVRVGRLKHLDEQRVTQCVSSQMESDKIRSIEKVPEPD